MGPGYEAGWEAAQPVDDAQPKEQAAEDDVEYDGDDPDRKHLIAT
jgi:hypothetical protein